MYVESKKLIQTARDVRYEGHGLVMEREYGKHPINGVSDFNGQWVLRDYDNEILDYDRYRSDLAERNDIALDDGMNY